MIILIPDDANPKHTTMLMKVEVMTNGLEIQCFRPVEEKELITVVNIIYHDNELTLYYFDEHVIQEESDPRRITLATNVNKIQPEKETTRENG
jgi:hypothetical protein